MEQNSFHVLRPNSGAPDVVTLKILRNEKKRYNFNSSVEADKRYRLSCY